MHLLVILMYMGIRKISYPHIVNTDSNIESSAYSNSQYQFGYLLSRLHQTLELPYLLGNSTYRMVFSLSSYHQQ